MIDILSQGRCTLFTLTLLRWCFNCACMNSVTHWRQNSMVTTPRNGRGD